MSTPPKRRPPRPTAKATIGGGNVLLDGEEHTPAVSPYADAEWRKPTPLTLADLPEPPEHELTDLPAEPSEQELAAHALCVAAIESGIRGFVMMGRALEYEQKSKVYRGEHKAFEEFTQTRFGFGRDRAEQFIRAWRVGARLLETAPGVSESHVRELLPVAAEHGNDAAALVYETIAGEAPKVTAGVVRGVVGVLPDRWRKTDVVKRIKEYLRSEPQRTPAAPPEVRTWVKGLRAITREVRTAESPEQRHEVAARLRELADEVENPR
ncbi:MAG TPA: hypothetical protein VGL93_10625 [Streptosporangiaceae bacterium]|jgi:hypothetical protein